MDFFDELPEFKAPNQPEFTPQKQPFDRRKIMAFVLAAIVIVGIIVTLAFGITYFVKINQPPDPNPEFPNPVTGIDDSAKAYMSAAKFGITRTVCIRGMTSGMVDDNVFWSGFLVSSDGYIVTHYTRAQGGNNIIFTKYTHYAVTVLDNEGTAHRYLATATELANKSYNLLVLKVEAALSDNNIPDRTVELNFDYFEFADPNSLDYGTPLLIMGDAVGKGLMAHSSIIGNPSTTFTNAYNDFSTTPVMAIEGSVNKGSSGSPLITADGKVAGMILSKLLIASNDVVDQSVQSLGFATQVDEISRLVGSIPRA